MQTQKPQPHRRRRGVLSVVLLCIVLAGLASAALYPTLSWTLRQRHQTEEAEGEKDGRGVDERTADSSNNNEEPFDNAAEALPAPATTASTRWGRRTCKPTLARKHHPNSNFDL